MSKLWATPVQTAYKVNFYSGGDTTRQAFSKHIQEIDRIYGLLNALDTNKVSASDISGSLGSITSSLTAHINSANPHPNWKPSFSDISGTLPGSRVVGALPYATIDASNVTGLTSVINGQLPAPSGDGITSSSPVTNGYAKFKNGLIIQWGKKTLSKASWNEGTANSATFPTAFPNECFIVTAGTEAIVADSNNDAVDCIIQVKNITKTGFKYLVQNFYGSSWQNWTSIVCSYIAIGK